MMKMKTVLSENNIQTDTNIGLPDNGHGGGVIFVLINSHYKHWSIR